LRGHVRLRCTAALALRTPVAKMGGQPDMDGDRTNKTTLEEAAAYVEKHKVFQLFEGLLQDLLIAKPEKPLEHLISSLQAPTVPRVVIAGPPAAETRVHSETLAVALKCEHVSGPELWTEAAKAGTAAGLQAKALMDEGKPISLAVQKALLLEKLTSPPCLANGWVLEGFPTTEAEAHAMLSAGLLPTTFLHLDLGETEATRRLTGRRVDQVENQVYHLDDSPPPADVVKRLVHRAEDKPDAVADRLLTYRQDMTRVLDMFKSVRKSVDASLSKSEIDALILPLVSSAMPSRAPRGCPRVLLLGGPGSGVDELADAVAMRYGVVSVSARELLHAESLKSGPRAKKIASMIKMDIVYEIPDEIVTPIILKRLSQEDVRKRGFVLTGYPSNAAQLAILKKANIWLRDVVLLDISPEAAARRLTLSRIDPVDGTEYHPDAEWPSDPVIQARLVEHPHRSEPAVRVALSAWAQRKKLYMSAYPALIVEDSLRTTAALEERLAPYF